MKKYRIKNEDIKNYNGSSDYSFPKYTSQLINWANQNAQGTRPKQVGQLSELFPDFMRESDNITIEHWHNWYYKRYPDAIPRAAHKIYDQVLNLKEAIQLIDYSMVEDWVEDLVINKTFNGLYVQKAILAFLGEKNNDDYRLATPSEESKGIDGYVGETPYSIKPESYKTMTMLRESIDVNMIYYTKTQTGLTIEVDDDEKDE